MVAGLLRNSNNPSPEPFPPGTRITLPEDEGTPTQKGTIEAIICTDDSPSDDKAPTDADDIYVLRLDSGTAIELDFSKLYDIVNPPDLTSSADSVNASSSVPYWIGDGAKVTMDHNGEYQKGFIFRLPTGTYRFSVRRRGKTSQEILGVDLPSFASEWASLCDNNILIPGHTAVSSFLHPSSTLQIP